MPECPFAGEQPVAEEPNKRAVIGRLGEIRGLGDQYVFDVPRIHEQTDRHMEEPDEDDVAMIFRVSGVETEPISR